MPERKSRITILDTHVDAISMEKAIELIIERSRQTGSCYVVRPYVEFFKNKEYSALLNDAWLSLPDGVNLQWAAHFQQTSGSFWQLIKSLAQIVVQPQKIKTVIPDKFAGINFTWPLLEAAAKNNRSVFLVGSPKKGSIEQTEQVIKNNIPNLEIAGTLPGRDESGDFSKNLEYKLLQELRGKRPDIVLLGLGFPRQEKVMQRLHSQLEHGVLIGEGGTFDYRQFGGNRKKAPRIIQNAGLEWLWRLMLEPKRLRRQLTIPRFIARVYRDLQRG